MSPPRRRRERNPRASAIVLGQPATGILHQGVSAHLIRYSSKDHPKRYAPGMRLAVKVMVPGPNACHVRLTEVNGPRQKFRLGHLTVADARALGHTRLDHLWRSWITNHDQEWLGRKIEAGEDTYAEIERRFSWEWGHKLVWLLRFEIDTTEQPRMLSRMVGGSPQFETLTDGRQAYKPRHDEQEADRGYTSSDSLTVNDSGVALTDGQWDLHIGPKSPYRIADHIQARKAQTWQARLAAATEEAKHRRKDIRDELRRFHKLMGEGKTEKAMRQLELIEQRAYPSAA